MKQLTKHQQKVQAFIIESYKDDPKYSLFVCGEHAVFAKLKGIGNACPHCGKESVEYKSN